MVYDTNVFYVFICYICNYYKIKRKAKKQLILWCLTMIDPVTGSFEIAQISNKTAVEVADVTERTWFT